MLNPILYTEKVLADFLRYQLTRYAFAERDLYAQMRSLLNLEETRHSPLLKGPYISLSRGFRRGPSVEALVKDGVLHSHMRNVLAGWSHVYGHQERAFRHVANGRTTLVSTGTGSGKTECFLAPIISHCLRLRDQNAGPGISAVIIYPMNALAEDQLGRLRELLAGTGITFGMYVGKTPEAEKDIQGKRLPAGSSNADYCAEVKRSRERGETFAIHPPEERVCREEMRTPGQQPRILLTNVKQLELLLTRYRDVELFDDVRLDHLVVDEAHTFRGAAGAETACLIRRLRAFCGKEASQTTCIATSATLADPERGEEAAKEFAARFFGVDPNGVELVAEEYEPDMWADQRYVVPPVLAGEARVHLQNVLDAVEQDDTGGPMIQVAYRTLTGGRKLGMSNWRESLYKELAQNELVYQVAHLLTRPRSLDGLLEELKGKVGREVSEEELLAWLALGAASRVEGRPLLRPVVHTFVRGVEGAVVTFPEDQKTPKLWLSAEDATEGKAKPELFSLAVTSCTTCGQHYFVHHVKDFSFTEAKPGGGDADGGQRFWQPLDEQNGGCRVVLLDKLITDDPEDEEADSEVPPKAGSRTIPRSCAEVHLCRSCGTLHETDAAQCSHCGRQGRMINLLVVKQKEKNPGYLTSCVSCGTLGRTRPGGYREPARPVRALTVSDVHVLAQNMLQQAERKRLLIFTDSRQDAAFQAGWMQDHARRFRLRALINEELQKGPVAVGDLVARLLNTFDQDDELSRSLAPEVWRVEKKASAPESHREQLKLFMRIQVLRELTLGLKQRIGLEPWGRLRVSYNGMDENHSFFTRWAGVMGVEPKLLLSSIEALLDTLRRRSLLHDPETHLFDKFRHEGDFLVQRGYTSTLQGVPKGLKLSRGPSDDPNRVEQLLSEKGDTIPRQKARDWGISADDVSAFLDEFWKYVTDEVDLFVPVTLTGNRGKALPKCAGVRQMDVGKLILEPHRGMWRCTTCRRVHSRPTIANLCMAWRCKGTIAREDETGDEYDLRVLDEQFEMIRPREHSAQVPAGERETLERQFKSEDERVNTLVCTPTLELGVDIGALDSVLMRNVPPLPANYWQRAGRAGRRHRLSVNLTYSRSVSHDRAYFRDPLKLLEGLVTPPRFNMRNGLMVKKHVHAATLTAIQALGRNQSPLSKADRDELAEVFRICFPPRISEFLFDGRGDLRTTPQDVTGLTTVLTKHEARIIPLVERAFRQGWPEIDSEVVRDDAIRGYVLRMGEELASILGRLWKRLQWAVQQLARLDEERRKKGTLEPDQDALHTRCDRLVKKLKGFEKRNHRESEGHDDTNTYAVLATEGFLPGYGLDTGSVRGTAMGSMLSGTSDFELPRPSSTALREYVPGNLIYANGHKFYPRYYHLDPRGSQDCVRLLVDVETEAVTEKGGASGEQSTGPTGLNSVPLRAVPICDVDLPQFSQITDEDDFRFRMPVAVFGREQGRHGSGQAYRWGNMDLQCRRGVHLRLVNVGESKLVSKGTVGYPVCLVCGQSRSPLASQRDRQEFETYHQEHCRQKVEPTGFYADVVADALTFLSCKDREVGYSLVEAIRCGASNVLEMELDDLQIVSIAAPGSESIDLLLYDPMPGGSGLLEQLIERWPEVVSAAQEVCKKCAGACATSCPDCLQSFRNAHTHKYLNRHTAIECLEAWGDSLKVTHPIPPKQAAESAESTGTQSTNDAEDRLGQLLTRAGFQNPIAQKAISLGQPYGATTPDFFYEPDHDLSEGVCLYLDGMSKHLHGDAERAEVDRQIREKLESIGYDVRTIPRGHLDDRNAMTDHFVWLARKIGGKTRSKSFEEKHDWWG